MNSSQFRAQIFPLLAALLTALTAFLGSGSINVQRLPGGPGGPGGPLVNGGGLNSLPRSPNTSSTDASRTTTVSAPGSSAEGLASGKTTDLRPAAGQL